MLNHEVKITSDTLPQAWSFECADFINKVINKILFSYLKEKRSIESDQTV
jgi:hypothetical protein